MYHRKYYLPQAVFDITIIRVYMWLGVPVVLDIPVVLCVVTSGTTGNIVLPQPACRPYHTSSCGT